MVLASSRDTIRRAARTTDSRSRRAGLRQSSFWVDRGFSSFPSAPGRGPVWTRNRCPDSATSKSLQTHNFLMKISFNTLRFSLTHPHTHSLFVRVYTCVLFRRQMQVDTIFSFFLFSSRIHWSRRVCRERNHGVFKTGKLVASERCHWLGGGMRRDSFRNSVSIQAHVVWKHALQTLYTLHLLSGRDWICFVSSDRETLVRLRSSLSFFSLSPSQRLN